MSLSQQNTTETNFYSAPHNWFPIVDTEIQNLVCSHIFLAEVSFWKQYQMPTQPKVQNFFLFSKNLSPLSPYLVFIMRLTGHCLTALWNTKRNQGCQNDIEPYFTILYQSKSDNMTNPNQLCGIFLPPPKWMLGNCFSKTTIPLKWSSQPIVSSITPPEKSYKEAICIPFSRSFATEHSNIVHNTNANT